MYFPDIGRYTVEVWNYDRSSMEQAFCGITTNKNSLGAVAFICGLFLFWDLIERNAAGRKKGGRVDFFSRILLILMVIWLLASAHSATSVVCFLLGTGILLMMRYPFFKRQARYVGLYSILLIYSLLFLYFTPGVLEAFMGFMGRDITLTGRTYLWADLMKLHTNPVFGTGYGSFWLGDGAAYMWRKYSFHPTQAHNGYLETYLNVGLVGVFILIALIISTWKKIKKELLNGNSFAFFGFSYFVVALFYNFTEARFGGEDLVWFILLLIVMSCQLLNKPIFLTIP